MDDGAYQMLASGSGSDGPSITSDELIDALNEGIEQTIKTAGKILPSSCIPIESSPPFQCEWISFSTELCCPAVEDLRKYFPPLQGNEYGSDGRPLLYATCLGLLLSNRDDSIKKDEKITPLSIFASVASFLLDELGLDPNQPTYTKGACMRPPLHLLARSCYPSAVSLLISKGADYNDTDNEGWTPLMACCLPDIPPSEHGGPTIEERVETMKVLLKGDGNTDNETNVDASNYCGYTALHYACEGLKSSLIECLLKDGGADPTIRTIWGQSCIGIIKCRSFVSPEDASKCEAIILTHLEQTDQLDSIRSFLDEEEKAIKLMDLVYDVLIPAANNQESAMASQDERIICALMNQLNIVPEVLFQKDAFQQFPHEDGNLYEIIFNSVMELVPLAYRQVFRSSPTNEEREVVIGTQYNIRNAAETFNEDDARRIDTQRVMNEAFKVHRERGHVAGQLDMLNDLIVGPLHRTLAFGTPSNAVLRKIVEHAPRIVEMGAGTGYWSYILDRLGADIVAYDASPTEAVQAENGNEYFGSQSYFPVQKGDATTVFGDDNPDNSERALLMVWPNNPDDIDNKHVAVEGPTLPPIWDIDCLQTYHDSGGDTVIYVGERESNIKLMDSATGSDCGFCSSRKFQTFLQEHYELTAELKCPQWWMKEDDVTIWKRK